MYAPDTELPQCVYNQAKERTLAQQAQPTMAVEGRTRLALHQCYVEVPRAAGTNEGRVLRIAVNRANRSRQRARAAKSSD